MPGDRDAVLVAADAEPEPAQMVAQQVGAAAGAVLVPAARLNHFNVATLSCLPKGAASHSPAGGEDRGGDPHAQPHARVHGLHAHGAGAAVCARARAGRLRDATQAIAAGRRLRCLAPSQRRAAASVADPGP